MVHVTALQNKNDFHWITGLTDTELLCVLCKNGEKYPKTAPRPITSTVPLQIPIVSQHDFARFEESYLRMKINFEHNVKLEELSGAQPCH